MFIGYPKSKEKIFLNDSTLQWNVNKQCLDLNLGWISCHFIVHRGEANRYPRDFISISMENLNYSMEIGLIFSSPDPGELLSPLSVRRPSVNFSHFNQLLWSHRANLNQTLVEWPLPKLCPVIPTSNQDGRQAKNRKKGEWNFDCSLLL